MSLHMLRYTCVPYYHRHIKAENITSIWKKFFLTAMPGRTRAEVRGKKGDRKHVAFVALGSNQGDRIRHLRRAVSKLNTHPEIVVKQRSPVYETRAHTRDPKATQPSYLNAVVELRTSLTPEALLAVCHALERQAGRNRTRHQQWAPRPLDLDLLVFDRDVRRSDHLTVPHPRLGERRFVLQPWADIAPNAYVPSPFDATVAELLKRCPDNDVPVRTEAELLGVSDVS